MQSLSVKRMPTWYTNALQSTQRSDNNTHVLDYKLCGLLHGNNIGDSCFARVSVLNASVSVLDRLLHDLSRIRASYSPEKDSPYLPNGA